MTTRHVDFKYQMCIIVAWPHFTWLYRVTRRSKCTAVALGRGLIPPPFPSSRPDRRADRDVTQNMIIPRDPASVGLSLARPSAGTCEECEVSVKTGQLRPRRHRPWQPCVQGHLVESCLDHSAVPQVCEETLGKVRADCLKDGTNVT